MKVIVESLAEEFTEVIGESLVVVLVLSEWDSGQRAILPHHSATAHGSSLNSSVEASPEGRATAFVHYNWHYVPHTL